MNNQTEEILTEETRKLVGYIMPVLEAMQVSSDQKQSIKKILWTFKENLNLKLNQEQLNNDKFNK
tara:strand:+ start:100 stop:294 length:195 start_codon:yes stop_codon:yes gene_type:complete